MDKVIKTEEFKETLEYISKNIIEESNIKQEIYNEKFIDTNNKELLNIINEETKESIELTNNILEKECNGDINDENTMFKVLESFSQDCGKSIKFYDSKNGINDSTKSTQYFAGMFCINCNNYI